MADLSRLCKVLEENGFQTSHFPTAQAAADYLNGQIDGRSVAFGGSMTLKELGLYPRLSTHNRCIWHWEGDALSDAQSAQVYLTSVNGLSETGELINIDGTGNRVAAALYGHQKVYFVVGVNKVAPDYDAALHRARNIAAPKNAQRLGADTPCAKLGDRCYDCKSPKRICRALTVLWRKPNGIGEAEVVLVDEALGY